MKVLIIGAPFLPLPAVEGGAVESLVDEYLKYNAKKNKYNITVYSPYSKKINKNTIEKYNNTCFRYIKKETCLFKYNKIKQALLRRILKNKQVHTAYCECIINDLKNKNELDKYDIIIIENQVESLIRYSKKIQGKIINHLHNDYLNIKTKDAKRIVKACDEFWGVSNFICNQIKEINKESKTKVLYNGIDIEKFTTKIVKKEQDQLYKKINFTKEDFIILYVGRIMPEKGVLELIKSFNRIKKKNDNLKLLIVGKKKNEKKEINDYYSKMLQEKQKNENSIFFYGNASFNELKVIYNISNIQVVPTLCEEAFGLVVLEGMCAKLPLIITDSGGMNEIAKNNVEIIKRKNILEELPEKIMKLYNEQEKKDKIIDKYNKILSGFTLKKYCENLDKYIFSCARKANNNEKN